MAIKLNRKGTGLSGVDRNKENENLTMIENAFVEVDKKLPTVDNALVVASEAKEIATSAESKSNNVQKQLSTLVVEGDSSPQAAQASVGADGKVYTSLKERLDAEQQAAAVQLAETATKEEVDSKLAQVITGSPKGSFATLADLKTAYPTGATGVYVVTADGKWYYWKDSNWISGGVYQAVLSSDFPSTNGIVNGNFNGTTGWTGTAATLSSSSNTLAVTGNGTSASVRASQNSNLLLVAGHKYYIKAKVRSKSSVKPALLIRLNGTAAGTLFTLKFENAPVQNELYNFAAIFEPTNQAGNLQLWFYSTYPDAASSLNQVTEMQYVIAVDLTATFGAGKEPAQTEFESILASYPNSWFDGTVSPLIDNTKLYSYLKGVESDAAVSKKQTSIFTQSLNLFNKNHADIVRGQFISNSGVKTALASAGIAGKIYINPKDKYVFLNSSTFNVSTKGGYYDKYDQFVTNIVGTVTGSVCEITVPDNHNISYMLVNFGLSDIDALMIVKGSIYPSQYVEYYRKLDESFRLNDFEKKEIEEIVFNTLSDNPDVPVAPDIEKNVLHGKTAIFNGDSICNGSSANDGLSGWAGRIGNKNNMVWKNYAIGGGTIAAETYSGTTPKHWISRNIKTMYNEYPNADYVILEGGTNDADLLGRDAANIGNLSNFYYSYYTKSEAGVTGAKQVVSNGSVTDIATQIELSKVYPLYYSQSYTPIIGDYVLFNEVFNDKTFLGAVDSMFSQTFALFPNAKIGFIIAHKMGVMSQGSKGWSPEVSVRRYYFDLLIQACEKWGVPYIDLWKTSTLVKNRDFINGKQFYTDGQHLTSAGYDVIVPKIEAWMKTL